MFIYIHLFVVAFIIDSFLNTFFGMVVKKLIPFTLLVGIL